MKLRDTCLASISVVLLFINILTYLVRVHVAGMIYAKTDFLEFYQAVRFYFAGQDLYSPICSQLLQHHHWVPFCLNADLNPPFFTLLLLPLYPLNYAAALMVWIKLSVMAMIVGFVGIAFGLSVVRYWWQWMLIGAGFFIYVPNSVSLAYGQLSAMTFLFTVMLWLTARARYDIIAGIFLGIMCSVKLFFGLFFIYFLVLRRWRLLWAGTLTYIMGLTLGWYWFGIKAYSHYQIILHKVAWYATSWNPSFLGEFTRWFSPTEKNTALFDLPKIAPLLTVICSSALVIYLLRTWWKIAKVIEPVQQQDLFDLGFSLTLIAMLLLSPLGWLYYFGLLLLPYLILHQQAPRIKKGWILQLFAPMLLLISTLAGDLITVRHMHTAKQILLNAGWPFYSLVTFLFLMIYLCHQRLRDTTESVPPAPIISESLWLFIYGIAFIPSLFSLGYMWRNILFIVSKGVSS